MEKMVYRSVLKPKKEGESKYFGRRAVTYFKLLGYNSETNTSIIQVEPLTTTPDQINIHLADGLGCPILGDHKYSSDFNLRAGIGNINFIKKWFKLSKSQPLNERLYKALGFGAVSQTMHLPLHLHLARIYIPGMAGDRLQYTEETKAKLLLPKSENQQEFHEIDENDRKSTHAKYGTKTGFIKGELDEFLMNSGSTLLCEAKLPNFWKETLYRCGLLKEVDIFQRMVKPQSPRLYKIHNSDELEINLTNVSNERLRNKLKIKTYENAKKVVKANGIRNFSKKY